MPCKSACTNCLCYTNRIATYEDKININLYPKENYKIEDDDSVGTALKKLRHQRGLTTRELANLSGLKIQHINEIERGEFNLTHKVIRSLYKVYNDDIKINPYIKYVLSDANIKFCEYIKEHNMNTTALCNYLGLSHDTITLMKRSTNMTYRLFIRINDKLEEMGLLEE